MNFSKLGLGTGTLASLGRAASFTEVQCLLKTMESLGETLIDTADSYGSGDCEKLLSRALRAGKSETFQVITKAGYPMSNLPGPFPGLNQVAKKIRHRLGARPCFEPQYLEKSLEASLVRLRLDRVEAFLLHDPPLEAVTSDEVAAACLRFRETGKARFVGVSSGDENVIRHALDQKIFQVIQTPANLMAALHLQPVWKACDDAGIHLIGNHVFSPECLAVPGMDRRSLMRASAALLPGRATILSGTRNPEHFRECRGWVTDPMDVSEARQLVSSFLQGGPDPLAAPATSESATNLPS